MKITDTTIIKVANSGKDLLQNWIMECNDKKIKGKIKDFVNSTKTNSPTGFSGATILPPVGSAFMK